MKILAIVVTYNGAEWIDKCVKSLTGSTIPIDILVVDNSSTDLTVSILRKNHPKVEVIETGQNLGFGKANNIGLKRCYQERYNYALLLNQDAWLDPNTLKELIAIEKINSGFGVLAPMQFNGDGTLIDNLFLQFTVNRCRKLVTDLVVEKHSINNIYETGFLNAACWLLPYSTIEKIGGFDPIYPHYGEDKDYINRIFYHGFKVGLCPKLKVFHDRENRTKSSDWKKESNRLFVRMLINLKDNNNKEPSRFYQMLQILNNVLKWIFGRDKRYHKAKLYASLKVYKNLKTIFRHRKLCFKEQANFLG